ncbi:MAG: alpha/beta fold hydrolase [Chloroflexi bacterium]|nr:alpha/beta fold hydrolase [Chloroflexota bacterium]
MNKIKLNRLELAYERRGKGIPLALIHGYPFDHSIWNEVAAELENDFDLIIPDVRGFGESTTMDSPYSISDIASDLAALLDSLGVEQTALAGHSMGGYIALAFAKAFSNRVTSLALVSSQTAADSPERKDDRYKTASAVSQKGVQIVADAMTDKFSPKSNVRDVVRLLIARQSVAGVAGALRAMADREDLTSFIAAFTPPLVLIHGDADELIPIDKAREIKSLVPSAHLVELRGVGHMPMMEMPVETASALKRLK